MSFNEVVYEAYYNHNKQHRLDGPSSIFYHEDDSIEYEYRVNGKLCSLDGPVKVQYYSDGRVLDQRCKTVTTI